MTVNGMSIHNMTLTQDSQYDEACSLFNSGRMGRVSLVTKPTHVNDNTIVIGVNLKGISKVGVNNVQVYSIKKDLLNSEPTVTSDVQAEQNIQTIQGQ